MRLEMLNVNFEEIYPNHIYKLIGDGRPEILIWRHSTKEPFTVTVVARYDPDGLEYRYNLFDNFLNS